jgi:hypothetical protein
MYRVKMLRIRLEIIGSGDFVRLYFGRGGRGRLGGGPGQGGNCEGRWAGMLIECERELLKISKDDIPGVRS